MATTFRSLGELRERHLGLHRATVAYQSGISNERLAALEQGSSPATVHELERLADVYGMDADALAEQPIRIGPGDALGVLALQSEFKTIGDTARLRVLQAAAAARDLLELRLLLEPDRPDPRLGLQRRLPQPQRRKPGEKPFEAGKRLASEFRKHFGLGTGPVGSVRDLAALLAPDLTVLYSRLASVALAGVTFVDAVHGPTVVLNLAGKNENVGTRRFSLAHELCHLVADWNRQEPIGLLSGFLDPQKLEREQRANAFAAYLLCPPSRVEALLRKHAPLVVAREMMQGWGIHYGACHLYLKNVANVDLPPQPPLELDVTGALAMWEPAEQPLGLANFPLSAVPEVRRTYVARLAASAWSQGRIQRDRFAALLGLAPDAEVERVLDFFELDRPEFDA